MLFRLSKSKLLSGIQCPKRLYLEVHHPELADQSDGTGRLFANGHRVGEIARQAWPKGRLVEHPFDRTAALKQTSEMLEGSGSMTLFEAAFQHGGLFARADVLSRTRGQCNVVEVKSSGKVTEYHETDAAIQRWVIHNAGYPVKSIAISHIDTSFVYPGNNRYEGLFKAVDVTEQALEQQTQVPRWISEFRKMLAGKMPRVAVGPQCTKPFACPFMDHCHKGQPEYPVEILPRGGKLIEALRADGYRDLRTVPANRIEGTKQKLVWRTTKKGKPEIDPRVRMLARAYAYPRYYLDFEAIQFAVPIWKGTRPYEQLPFQWSCHMESEGGVSTHKEFINVTGEPPMRQFAESLIAALGQSGAIVVWGSFEGMILQGLAKRFPDLEVPLMKIARRINDLLPIARSYYYHRDMQGSWSLKLVLPTIAPDLDYSKLDEVQEGGMAQTAYLEAIDPATPLERREKLVNSLRKYCKMDTLALVRIARFFGGS